MTQQHTPLRSSLTAIAAVLALSSTAAFAQSADQAAPDTSAPAIAAPPPPVVSAAPATVEPAIAEPTTSLTAAPVEPSAPVAATPSVAPMATRSTPVIHTPDADASAKASQPVKHAAAVTHVATTTRSTVSTTKSTTPTPAPVVQKAAPAPVADPTPAPALAPAAATTATTRTNVESENDQMLEVGGALGLGVIVLGAGAFLLGRRRRREEDEEDLILATEPTEGTIVTPVTSPTYAAATEAVTATPVLARTEDGDEQMTLANGFDLSPFGRHVRAAYRGPTEDNPSHSLRKRLAHARFFDLRERQAIERGELVAPEPQPIAARAAKATAVDNDQIVVRPGYRKPSRFFGTAFQR